LDSSSLIKNKILVHIYGYKESELLNVVDSLLSNASAYSHVDIYIDDQNNLTRYDKFKKYNNVFYNPVWWDELESPLKYRQSCIQSQINKGYDYFLFLSKPYILPTDWDIDLIDLIPDFSVLSGKGIIKTKIVNNFYIKKETISSDKITNTGYIDQSFIFGNFKDLLNINIPYQLKYYGIDEYLSISFLNNGINIYSMPSDYYSDKKESLLNKDYVPFSLNHNYNDLLDMLINKSSVYLKYEDPSLFITKVSLDISLLNKLPFSFNDIEYNRFSELDNIGGKRYIEKRYQVS
jgi:hypothetical protein